MSPQHQAEVPEWSEIQPVSARALRGLAKRQHIYTMYNMYYMYIYIYTHIHTYEYYMCIYIYIYTYTYACIYRARDKQT